MAPAFDDNVFQEILSRLPAKSLGRLLSVSRRFRELISSHMFKSVHARRSKDNILGLLSVTVSGRGPVAYTPLHNHNNHHEESPGPYLGIHPPPCCLKIKATCNGFLLIELHHSYIVINPTTKSIPHTIPLPDSGYGGLFGLALDSKTFKVVIADENVLGSYWFHIYTPAMGWRRSQETLPYKTTVCNNSISSVFFGDTMHWLTEGGDLMSFNIETEKAQMTALPTGQIPKRINGYSTMWLGVSQDCMTMVNVVEGDVLVWVVEEGNTWSWNLKQTFRGSETGSTTEKAIPLLYNANKCVLLTWEHATRNCWLAVYRTDAIMWEKMELELEDWMDRCRHFLPYVGHMF